MNNLRRWSIGFWVLAMLPPIALAALNLHTQYFYSNRSLALRGQSTASFVEIPEASSEGLANKFRTLAKSIPPTTSAIVADTDNIVLAKLLALFFRRQMLTFPSTDFFKVGQYNPEHIAALRPLRDKDIERVAMRLSDARNAYVKEEHFHATPLQRRVISFVGPPRLESTDDFFAPSFDRDVPRDRKVMFELGSDQSPLNRLTSQGLRGFDMVRWNGVENRVIFVDSSWGHSYVYGTEPEAFFQLEPDYFFSGGTMVGVGRYLLLRIENPTPRLRIEMWLSTSLRGDGQSLLPPAVVVGKGHASFHVVGRGAARLISDPLEPQMIDGAAYVLIDMGVDGALFKRRKLGALFGLYRNELPLDHRRIVAFVRDISVLSERRYETERAPSFVRDSAALSNEVVYYSGIYEDGWLSDHASLLLTAGQPGAKLAIDGYVPKIGNASFATTVSISLDGRVVKRSTLRPGNFSIEVLSPGSKSAHRLRLDFSRFQRLPAGDTRPVAARLCSVGFPIARRDATPFSGC
jgi:hypothetical protein